MAAERASRGQLDRGQLDRGQLDRGQLDRGQPDRSPADRGQPDRAPAVGGKLESGQGRAPSHPAHALLEELSSLLEAERDALVRLDREAIAAFAARKLELDQALAKAVAEQPLGAAEKDVLERVRNRALDNQLLLAHARSCVQGVLSLLTPANTP